MDKSSPFMPIFALKVMGMNAKEIDAQSLEKARALFDTGAIEYIEIGTILRPYYRSFATLWMTYDTVPNIL